METPLRVLVVEDSEDDTLLLMHELERGGYAPEWARVATANGLIEALDRQAWDLVLTDYTLPQFSGLVALDILHTRAPDLPVIIVTGTVSEDAAVRTMRAGAGDFIVKHNLDRLIPAIQRELREAAERRAHRQAEDALRKFSRAVDQIPSMIIIADAQGLIEYVNPKFTQITGYTLEEVMGKPPKLLKGDDTAPEVHYALWQAITAGAEWHGEFHNRKKDGSAFWVAASVSPIRDARGAATHFLAIEDDITARKQAETALRESEDRYRRLVELSPDGIVMYSEGRVVFANQTAVRLIGIEQAEAVLGQPALTLIHPDHREALAARVLQSMSEGLKAPFMDEKLVRLDGTTLDIELAAIPIAYKGKPAVQVVVRDITARKQAELALRQRQRELESLLETSRDLLSVRDLDTLLALIAQRAQTLLRAEACTLFRLEELQDMLVPIVSLGPYADQMMNAGVLRVGQGITGTSVARNTPVLANNVTNDPRAVHVPGTPWENEHLMVAPLVFRGKTIGAMLVSRTAVPFFTEEEFDLFVGFAHHAAIAMQNAQLVQSLEAHSERLEQAVEARTIELRQTKERVEAILSSSPDAILMLDTRGAIESVNQTFCDMFGYRPDEVRNQLPFILAEPSRSDAFRELLRAVLEAGQAGRLEIIAQRRSGGMFDADVALAPIRENVAVAGAVCSIRDITALKEVERMKDAFVGNVSHELRTPISSIKLHHDLLVKNPSKQADYMERLKRETSRLERIIDDLLALSRLDQGKVRLARTPTDLSVLARQYVIDRVPLAQQRCQTLSFEDGSGVPLVMADRGLVGQALSILLTNALNYTPSGGTISVSTRVRQDDEQSWAGLVVSDTGPGIPPDEQPRLFERFFRGTAGRESGMPGTGLGLAILQEIVQRHFGWVEVISTGEAGQGATFILWLPGQA